MTATVSPTYVRRHRAHGRHRAPTRWQRLLADRQPWTLAQHFGATLASATALLVCAGVFGGLL